MGMGSRWCARVLVGLTVVVLAACSATTDSRPTPPPAPGATTVEAPPQSPMRRVAAPPVRWTSHAPVPLDVEGSRLVTDREDVIGRWRVVAISTGPVPRGALRGLWVSRFGRHGLAMSYSDGVNGFSASINRIRRDGRLGGRGSLTGTLVGCGDRAYTCGRPSGFGVVEARSLRLTADGGLALVDRRGAAVAIYERVT